MTIRFDTTLSESQVEQLKGTNPEWWFHSVHFANATSPAHPKIDFLDPINEWKWKVILPALTKLAPGKRVLDVFCANGGFSFEAARAGATEVLGLDHDHERVECARFVAGLLNGSKEAVPHFDVADVYRLSETVREPFDVTMAIGGLYHVADPVLVLRNLREVTSEHLILQTARMLWLPGSWGRFLTLRHVVDSHPDGRPAGVWKLSVTALEAMLGYAGFEVIERLPIPRRVARRFRWYAAVCRAK